MSTPDFWSPSFGQPSEEFDFRMWQAHYDARREALRLYFEEHLRQGGTILQSFGPTKPTDLGDTLWNLTGTRRLDAQGDIGEYDRPFIAECWTPEYIANHLARRTFGFNMRVATWLQ
jgi:hypothetical protein